MVVDGKKNKRVEINGTLTKKEYKESPNTLFEKLNKTE